MSSCKSELDKELYVSLMGKYLKEGYSVNEARFVIGDTHGLRRSIRMAQQYAQELGLGAAHQDNESSVDDLIRAAQTELNGVARNMGADAIWRRIKFVHHLKARRQTIRDIVEAIEPGRGERFKHGRLSRRLYKVKGPNHMWHIDGNDKLKPFGFCLSGCMDGFSRKLIWLKVSRTNKDPDLICSYYLEAITKYNAVPRIVRLDRGTENVHVANTQTLLRSEHSDSLASVGVMYGSSNHNQRIERFWLYLRQVLLNDYMDLFKDYVDSGIIDSSNITHMECLAFCFMPILRLEVDSVLQSWNKHRVRQMKHSGCPSGVPDILFDHPEIHAYANQAKPVNKRILNDCIQLHQISVKDCEPTFEQWALRQLVDNGLHMPSSMDEARSLFSKLIVEVQIQFSAPDDDEFPI